MTILAEILQYCVEYKERNLNQPCLLVLGEQAKQDLLEQLRQEGSPVVGELRQLSFEDYVLEVLIDPNSEGGRVSVFAS